MINIFSKPTCKNFVCVVAIVIFSAVGFFGLQSVSAQAQSSTVIYEVCQSGGPLVPCSGFNPPGLLLQIRITDSLDKSTYYSGEPATVSESIEVLDYSGGTITSGSIFSSVSINGFPPIFDDLSLYQGRIAQNSVTESIGNTVGNFNAIFSHTLALCTPSTGCKFVQDSLIQFPYSVIANTSCISLGFTACSILSNCCPPADTCVGSKCCITSALITCSKDNQCCAGHCNTQGKCAPDCTAEGLNCPSAPGQCCSGQCNLNGVCWSGCRANGSSCTVSYSWMCCSNNCSGGICKDQGYIPCPSIGTYCSYNSPLGYRVYDSDGILCPTGTLNTCPSNPSTYCPSTFFINSCGTRCPQGTEVCDPPLGYISVQGKLGSIKLNLISVANFQAKFIGTLKVLWKAGQPPAAADLVEPTDIEASPVRVKTTAGIRAWKRQWPAYIAPPSLCLLTGVGCQYSDDCCAKTCSGLCACKSNSTACVKDIECCSGYCPVSSKVCACVPMGGGSYTCQQNSQCCSGGCKGSLGNPGACCLLAGEPLASIGQYCSYTYNTFCCSGRCVDATNTCQ